MGKYMQWIGSTRCFYERKIASRKPFQTGDFKKILQIWIRFLIISTLSFRIKRTFNFSIKMHRYFWEYLKFDRSLIKNTSLPIRNEQWNILGMSIKRIAPGWLEFFLSKTCFLFNVTKKQYEKRVRQRAKLSWFVLTVCHHLCLKRHDSKVDLRFVPPNWRDSLSTALTNESTPVHEILGRKTDGNIVPKSIWLSGHG